MYYRFVTYSLLPTREVHQRGKCLSTSTAYLGKIRSTLFDPCCLYKLSLYRKRDSINENLLRLKTQRLLTKGLVKRIIGNERELPARHIGIPLNLEELNVQRI